MQHRVCLITFSSLVTDGRSLNALRSISKIEDVACFSQTRDVDYQKLNLSSNITHFSIPKTYNRMLFDWINFHRKVKNLSADIDLNIFWACDLYSLKAAVNLAKKDDFIIYDSREIYSALGNLSGKFIKQRILAFLEKQWIKGVDHFVVSGDLDARFLKTYFNTKKPFTTIYNVPQFKERLQSNIIKEKFPYLGDKTILLYQGAVHFGRGIELILNFIAKSKKYAFVILGDGLFLAKAKELAYKLDILDRVVFAGCIPYEELHNWTCSAHIGVNLIEPISFSYELALPNKMFEYIMAGLPQIASKLPAMQDIIDRYNVGICIENFSNEKIENSINEILMNYEFYQENCLKAAKVFNYGNEERKIFEIIASL
jgi:glycosyltransferase involved in cell wall biosynthesis